MSTDLLAISSFGRLVGLSPSALRFYDDCGLLRPARVDERTGYRYYTPDQESRGVLIRRLREIDLPLQQIRQVIDGSRQDAEAALQAHVESRAGLAARAREVAGEVAAALAGGEVARCGGAACVIGGAELAGAVRQVAPAAADDQRVRPLEGVLLEMDDDELTLVATNRYWLALRSVPVSEVEGGPSRAVISAASMSGAVGWMRRQRRIRLRWSEGQLEMRSADQAHTLDALDGEFPQYQSIFDGLETPAVRVVVDRRRLIDVLESRSADDTVVLSCGDDHLDVRLGADRHGTLIEAACDGGPSSVAFNPALITAALRAGVGPDALLEWVAQDRPVTVRTADQGTFTTLVMPVRLDRDAGQ